MITRKRDITSKEEAYMFYAYRFFHFYRIRYPLTDSIFWCALQRTSLMDESS